MMGRKQDFRPRLNGDAPTGEPLDPGTLGTIFGQTPGRLNKEARLVMAIALYKCSRTLEEHSGPGPRLSRVHSRLLSGCLSQFLDFSKINRDSPLTFLSYPDSQLSMSSPHFSTHLGLIF
jgi:hypothetical protein